MANTFSPFIKKGLPLVPKDAEIKPLELRNLAAGTVPTYSEIKAKFSPSAVSQSPRFMLSELVSNQLSVETEEQKRFEKRVEETVNQRLEQVRQKAQEDGFAAGSEAGRQAAFEAEKARLAKLMEGLATTLKIISTGKNQLAQQYESAMVEMSFRLARMIVHREIKERPEGIAVTIEAILNRIGRDDDVRIRLSPQEYDSIDQIQTEIKDLAREGRISFEVDSNLKAGDCVVESLSGEIASFIDEKFKKLELEIGRAQVIVEPTGT